MKRSSIFPGWQSVITLVVITLALCEPAYCQTNRVALILQQTPAEAGIIIPPAGIHHFQLNTKLTLTAAPKPDYRFLYWLGDVSNPTATRTIVYLDAPKIIIAVFELAEAGLEITEEEPEIQSTHGGGGGPGDDLIFSHPIELRPTCARGRRRRIGPWRLIEITIIPEPATVVLFALGSLFIFIKRRPKRQAR